jgi:hypothetical protein
MPPRGPVSQRISSRIENTQPPLNVKDVVGVRTRRKRGTKSLGPSGSVIVYLRVSTSEQALSGLGLEARRKAAKSAATQGNSHWLAGNGAC